MSETSSSSSSRASARSCWTSRRRRSACTTALTLSGRGPPILRVAPGPLSSSSTWAQSAADAKAPNSLLPKSSSRLLCIRKGPGEERRPHSQTPASATSSLHPPAIFTHISPAEGARPAEQREGVTGGTPL
ncbi:hypothetical protein GDO81_027289 [Engystomops pustulosus]|uniref:Uncharacterized protein n=1 Tax=Engystomops pustulosus TaxID=76066 RepID=A0AAV6ZNS9_ENGPU|nr:hypothetical protein GDO81_027289 [Engystomops pustulosus]